MYPENRLQIAGGRGGERARQHEHSRPLRHSHARCQLPTGQGNRVPILSGCTDCCPHLFQGVLGFFFFVAVSCDVDNLECAASENGMLFQKPAERPCLTDAGNHPEGVPEEAAVFFGGIGIAVLGILFGDEIHEAQNIRFMAEIARALSVRNRRMVAVPASGPGAEKFPEIERLILQFHVTCFGNELAQIVGIHLHLRQLIIGV